MGLKFRKRVKIAPGVKVNLTSKGVSSVSIGGKGATLNIGGKQGTKLTTTIPGTGISYTENLSSPSKQKAASSSAQPQLQGWAAFWVAIAAIALMAFLKVLFQRGL